MAHWTRRDFIRTGLAASAGAAAINAGGESGEHFSPQPTGLPTTEMAQTVEPGSSPRERLLLDFGWRFHLGHAQDPAKDFGFGGQERELTFAKTGFVAPVSELEFDDSAWRKIDLPHDWAVELPFTNAAQLPEHGGKALGRDYPETSIGWYRRIFELPASDTGKRIVVEFDGVFRNSMVMFNGHYLGENFSGYVPFRFDLTDFAELGNKNVLVVRVDATLGEGWFYEGAGIYRHVWLVKTEPLHIEKWGNYVRSEVQGNSASVFINTQVENENATEKVCRVTSRIVDTKGNVVTTAQAPLAKISPGEGLTFRSRATINQPRLWSIEEPHLYRAITVVESGGTIADQEETTFGVRTIRFDPDQGFFLNGKPVKIKGTCNHQDHAGVGSALPDRLQYYRIERLKDMQSNAYRTSHNPPTAELLDACDRLGMLVMVETRMMSSCPEGLSQLERMVRRDRNHPSIVIWSLGNEEPDQGSAQGARMVARMKQLVRKLDPTRPVTVAMNYGWGKGVSKVVDVQGFNYAGAGGDGGPNTAVNIDNFHRSFPLQPTIGTETASVYSTRGIYVNDRERGYVSAYDVNYPGYALSSEGWWKIFDERSFLAGGFAWTGFDYRGEPSPYSWPCISSHFGAMDTCGFPKDNFFYYQAWWGSKPVLHLFPHWNWSGKEGQEIGVWCHTNLDSVELLLNGRSLGSKTVQRNSHLEWKVRYEPGVLEARASKDGRVVIADKRETTGAPAGLVLRSDRQSIAADGEDLAVVVVEVVDGQGRFVPLASNEIRFETTGPGRLIGLGNGDPSCHESDRPGISKEGRRSAFNGLCMALVQSLKQPGEIRVEVSSPGLQGTAVVVSARSAGMRPAVS